MTNELKERRTIDLPCSIGSTIYKICPKCGPNHTICDQNCAWFGMGNPCDVLHTGYEQMVVEKIFHTGWRLKDLQMFGEKYFVWKEDAEAEIKRIST